MLFSGIDAPVADGSRAELLFGDSAFCSASVTFLATSLLIPSPIDGGDGMAGTRGGDITCPFPTVRTIVGAKITDAMASAMSNPARMNIARANGESPLRVAVVVERTAPRTFPIRAGGLGLPIVSA